MSSLQCEGSLVEGSLSSGLGLPTSSVHVAELPRYSHPLGTLWAVTLPQAQTGNLPAWSTFVFLRQSRELVSAAVTLG